MANFVDIPNGKWWTGYPEIYLGWVDVDDAALAHLRAIEVPEAANERFLIVKDSIHCRDMWQAIHDAVSSEFTGVNFRNKPAPYYLVWFLSKFSDKVKNAFSRYGRRDIYNSEKAARVLGIKQYRDI